MGVVREHIEFKRTGNSKESLQVGKISEDQEKWDKIPLELLEDWLETSFDDTLWDFNEKTKKFELAKIPRSASIDADWEKYIIQIMDMDELIEELSDHNNIDWQYSYNDETYEWKKLVREHIEFKRTRDSKESLGLGEYRKYDAPFGDELTTGFYILSGKDGSPTGTPIISQAVVHLNYETGEVKRYTNWMEPEELGEPARWLPEPGVYSAGGYLKSDEARKSLTYYLNDLEKLDWVRKLPDDEFWEMNLSH